MLSVQPLATTVETPYTHLIGSYPLLEPLPGFTTGIISGTGRFAGATGEVRLSGAASGPADATPINLSAMFIFELNLTLTGPDDYEYVFRKSGAASLKLHAIVAFMMAMLQFISSY